MTSLHYPDSRSSKSFCCVLQGTSSQRRGSWTDLPRRCALRSHESACESLIVCFSFPPETQPPECFSFHTITVVLKGRVLPFPRCVCLDTPRPRPPHEVTLIVVAHSAKLRELWVIPVFFVVTTTVSMTVAFVLGWTFRLKKSQR